MAIGRITGSVLKSNLTRNGVDLAFETNLLYLDVTNSRIGIGTSEPSTALHVNGTITASGLTGLASLDITNTSTGDSLLITSTEDSSTAAPVITLKRNSSSPADADYLGQLKFKGENDADQEVVYAKITGKIQDASDGTEDGIIEFAHKKAGSNVITARFRSDSFQLLNDTNFVARGLTYPTADGSAGQVIKTDGSGTLSFTTISTNSISQGDSNVTVTDSGTGSITIDADGSTIITMNATTVLDASATTNAIRLPGGTTAQRPSGAVGEIRYNSTTDTIEGYTSTAGWAQLGATTSTEESTDDTSAEDATALSTTQGVINQFTTSSFDSAWYLAITRDEINDEVATAKYSLVHNDTNAFVAHSHIVESDSSNSYLTVQADVTGGNARLLGTGGSVVNSVSIYRIAVGDNTSAATTGNVTTTINTDVDSAAEKIDGWALASYRGAKYYISVNNTTTGELSNTEALVVHDGSTAYITQYGNVNTGDNDLITLTAEVDSTEVVLKASAQAPNCRVTVYRILLADDESGSTGDNVNVIAGTTVSSSATTVDTFNTSTYTGAFYVFTGYNAGEGAASISEVMVVANDEAYIGTGPIVSTKGTDQLDFTASLSGSTVTVKASSTSGSSTTVNGYRVHMLRGSAGASTADTVLVSTEQTITGAKTFSVAPTFSVGYNESINALTSSSTITVDCSTARVHTVTLGTNTEFNITSLPTGGTVTLIITQDGTGSRTATFGTDGSAAVKFPASSSVLSTGANDIDVVSIFNDGTNFLGNIARNYG